MTGIPSTIKPVTRAFRFCGTALTVELPVPADLRKVPWLVKVPGLLFGLIDALA